MNKYKQIRKKQEQEINKFPIVYAFNEEQLNEALTKLNTTKENLKQVYGGGLIRKQDIPRFKALIENQHKEIQDSLKNENFLYEALVYELSNHEYYVTFDHTETLNVLDLEYDKMTKKQIKVLEKAVKDYLKAVEDYI